MSYGCLALAAAIRKVLNDAQLPPALARAIAQKGYSAEHVFDIGLVHAGDEAIWKHAAASGAILITKTRTLRPVVNICATRCL